MGNELWKQRCSKFPVSYLHTCFFDQIKLKTIFEYKKCTISMKKSSAEELKTSRFKTTYKDLSRLPSDSI